MTNPVGFIDDLDDTLARTRRERDMVQKRFDELQRDYFELSAERDLQLLEMGMENTRLRNLLKEVAGTLAEVSKDWEKLK